MAKTTRRAASSMAPRTVSSCVRQMWPPSDLEVLPQPGDVGGGVGGLGDYRGAGRAHDVQELFRVDRARLDGGVPVAAGAELVPRVVAVHQVDPAGDGPDPVRDAHQILAAGVGVA